MFWVPWSSTCLLLNRSLHRMALVPSQCSVANELFVRAQLSALSPQTPVISQQNKLTSHKSFSFFCSRTNRKHLTLPSVDSAERNWLLVFTIQKLKGFSNWIDLLKIFPQLAFCFNTNMKRDCKFEIIRMSHILNVFFNISLHFKLVCTLPFCIYFIYIYIWFA
jgi:hypothetical protein